MRMNTLAILKQMSNQKEEENTYRGVVCLVDDVMLMNFLKTKYPNVLQEFYEEVHNANSSDTQVHNEGLSSSDT